MIRHGRKQGLKTISSKIQIPVLVAKNPIKTNHRWLGSIIAPSVIMVLQCKLKKLASIQDASEPAHKLPI
jgi:hypothetical protein